MNCSIRSRNGLTLIELLVAISILTIVTALLIPRLRIVNKDRNIRETARIVGSAFSAARDKAIGTRASAGVIIERNINFLARTGNGAGPRVYYAGTRLSQLEEIVPPYTGDSTNDFVMTILTTDSNGDPTLQCLIMLPLDHEPANNRPLILAGDEILFGGGRYLINEVLPSRTLTFTDSNPGDLLPEQLCGLEVNGAPLMIDMLPLNIEFDNDNVSANALDVDGTVDFVTGSNVPQISVPISGSDVFSALSVNAACEGEFALRQLRKAISSSVDLPPGYMIDLRYSGPFDTLDWDDNNETWTWLGQSIDDAADENSRANREVQIVFDKQGRIDRLGANGGSVLVSQSIELFINEFNPDELLSDTAEQAALLLNKPNSLWVNVGVRGGASIAYSVPPGTAAVDSMLSSSRLFSRQRVSASQ